MRADHIKNRGFTDIAYHILIEPDGQCLNGRPLNQVGSHVKHHNEGAIGICLVGKDKFTQRQFDALRYKIDSILLTYPINKTEIYLHSQFDTAKEQGKTCPNMSINNILLWYYKVIGEQAIANYLYKEV